MQYNDHLDSVVLVVVVGGVELWLATEDFQKLQIELRLESGQVHSVQFGSNEAIHSIDFADAAQHECLGCLFYDASWALHLWLWRHRPSQLVLACDFSATSQLLQHATSRTFCFRVQKNQIQRQS